jgi:hypothetical protein
MKYLFLCILLLSCDVTPPTAPSKIPKREDLPHIEEMEIPKSTTGKPPSIDAKLPPPERIK